MNDIKNKIQKTAKILNVFTIIMEVAVMASIVVVTLGIIVSLFGNDELINTIKEALIEEELYSSISEDLEEIIPTKYVVIIASLFHIITRVILYIYLVVFSKMLKEMANGSKPFTDKNAKTIFIMSISVLIFVLSNPVIAIFLSLIGLLLSQLIKYGAYLTAKADEINEIQEDMIVSFAEVVENKSEQTGKHVKRVSEYSYVLALEMGYSEEDAERIKLASMMHDIGKLMVPQEILEKPAKLTNEEFDEIKKHPVYGANMLNTSKGDSLILAKSIAHDHHERVDGKGYPDGSTGDVISKEGRIVSVADVYDALTSKRSYKEAWDEKDAYNEIVKNSGTQFDKDVVDAFIRAYDKINKIRIEHAD